MVDIYNYVEIILDLISVGCTLFSVMTKLSNAENTVYNKKAWGNKTSASKLLICYCFKVNLYKNKIISILNILVNKHI